jgi:hypothetical protein
MLVSRNINHAGIIMSPFPSGRFRILFAGPIVLTVLVGCPSGGPKVPKTVAVSGKITYNDKPLAGAEVGFVSKFDNKDVLAARGVTNDSGEFTLSTYIDPQHEVAGATPGDFVVTVTKVEKVDQQKLMEQFRTGNPAMEGVFKKLAPPKYAEVNESPLTASVTVGGKNWFEFKLED